jgi:hypothetical protein
MRQSDHSPASVVQVQNERSCTSTPEFSLYGVHNGTIAFIYAWPTTAGLLIHLANNRFISLPHTTVQNAVIKTEAHKFVKVLQNSRPQRGDMKLIPYREANVKKFSRAVDLVPAICTLPHSNLNWS